NVLRAGLLMGKITATGLYGATIVGVLQAAYTSPATTLTVTAAQATEIARRVGQSATLSCVGPPSANGTVATTDAVMSAANTTSGNLTVTSLGVNKAAGSFLVVKDGSGVPNTLIPDGYGLQVTAADGSALPGNQTPFPALPIGGTIISTQIVNWPTDTS